MADGTGVLHCSFNRAFCALTACSRKRGLGSLLIHNTFRRPLALRAVQLANRVCCRVVARLTCLDSLQTLWRPFCVCVRGGWCSAWPARVPRNRRFRSIRGAGFLDERVQFIVIVVAIPSNVRRCGNVFRHRVSSRRVFGRTGREHKITLAKGCHARPSPTGRSTITGSGKLSRYPEDHLASIATPSRRGLVRSRRYRRFSSRPAEFCRR